MTEENKIISAEQIVESWNASPHMATALEYLYTANHTPYITIQIKNLEASVEILKKSREKIKDKDKHHAATNVIKSLKNEISRLRKKSQRGVSQETPADRKKAKAASPAMEKEIKRVHKATKKRRKVFKVEVGDASTNPSTDALSKLTQNLKSQMAKTIPAVEKAGAELMQNVADGAKKAGKKLNEVQQANLTNIRLTAVKKNVAKKKGKK